MPSGFKSKSTLTDMDEVFEPWTAGAKAPPVPFTHRDSGQNFSDRYAPRSAGGSADPTGWLLPDNRDLNQIYARKGSVGYLAGPTWTNTGIILQAAAAGETPPPPTTPPLRNPPTWGNTGSRAYAIASLPA